MADSQSSGLVVYVVDDDASIRDSLSLMLGLRGYATRVFSDAESLLVAYDASWKGCIVADLRLPGLSGIDLQKRLRQSGSTIPLVIITGHGDVPAARAAFLADAVDFIEKPFEEEALVRAIDQAFDRERRHANARDRAHDSISKLRRLTAREREVLELAATGLHAKEIGRKLSISARTVEVHKMRIMEKLEVRNIAELVRFVVDANNADRQR